MNYDGSSKLGDAIADLYGYSPKSHNRIAELVAAAKADLGITTKAKVLSDDVKLAIYQWHYDRLNPVCDIQQADDIQGTTQSEAAQDSPIQDVKQTENDAPDLLANGTVQYIKQNDNQSIPDAITQEALAIEDKPETQPDSLVCDAEQSAPVLDSKDETNVEGDFKQLHFGVTTTKNDKPNRTTVMLEAYLVEAMRRKHGFIDNSEVRLWIEQAIKADARFDSHKPLTKQVKRVITESLV